MMTAPSPTHRPTCRACDATGPTINGLCPAEFVASTAGRGWLECVSPEEVALLALEVQQP